MPTLWLLCVRIACLFFSAQISAYTSFLMSDLKELWITRLFNIAPRQKRGHLFTFQKGDLQTNVLRTKSV